jgi:hypothetical protein
MEPGGRTRDRRGVGRAHPLGDELLEAVDRRSERQPPGAEDLEDELFFPGVEVRPS